MSFSEKFKELIGIADEDIGGEDVEEIVNETPRVYDDKSVQTIPSKKNNKVVNIHILF